MKILLSKQFYQRYFAAINRQHADWLTLIPPQARMEMLAHLTQWDTPTLTDEQYRERL
ncbi:glucose uptake inhibitor SgrT [Serratia sp. NPDC078593]|uniref:glucose uptake inhibitor SgrT n=1 Tax=unclassified Serratia (in: enterobacteria) TaxID=2647522 RepID=UPI0037D085BD